MRNVIRQCRKNYWGVFDETVDPTTGRKKIWVPLTESLVEAVVKNIDLDTKDVNFRAKKQESIGLTAVIRAAVKNELEKINFGEELDKAERQLAIDGTIVWYTSDENDKAKVRQVDLLNFYIDPTANSIQEAESVIERIIVPLSEFKKLAKANKWVNQDIEGMKGLSRVDGEMTVDQSSGETKMVEMFKRQGLMPKSIITGVKKDENTLINGEIICSATNGTWVFHAAENRGDKLKQYEEAWYTRVPGRWYGKGIAEKVMMLQLWMNTIVNIRINRSYVSQLGIFKIRRGSGITPQMIGRLASNGAILVGDQADIEQMVMQEASLSSYKDEDVIQNWSERVTSAFEVVTGEGMPASTTATAIAQQSKTSQSQFVLIKEGLGMFLERWLRNHFMKIVANELKTDKIILLVGEGEELRSLDERVVNQMLSLQLSAINQMGGMVDPMQVEMERQNAIEKLSQSKERFVQLLEDIDFLEYDVRVDITNEKIDSGVLATNLVSVLQAAPEYKDQILQQLADVVGLQPFKKPQMGMMQNPQMNMPTTNPQQLVTEANTL